MKQFDSVLFCLVSRQIRMFMPTELFIIQSDILRQTEQKYSRRNVCILLLYLFYYEAIRYCFVSAAKGANFVNFVELERTRSFVMFCFDNSCVCVLFAF